MNPVEILALARGPRQRELLETALRYGRANISSTDIPGRGTFRNVEGVGWESWKGLRKRLEAAGVKIDRFVHPDVFTFDFPFRVRHIPIAFHYDMFYTDNGWYLSDAATRSEWVTEEQKWITNEPLFSAALAAIPPQEPMEFGARVTAKGGAVLIRAGAPHAPWCRENGSPMTWLELLKHYGGIQ